MYQHRVLHRKPRHQGEGQVSFVSIFDVKIAQPRERPLDADAIVVDMLRDMIKIPPAMKVWRGVVIEVLYDHRIFNSIPSVATKWKPIIKALFDADKTSFPDLLGNYASETYNYHY